MSQPPIISQNLKPAEILAIDDDEWFLRLLVKKFEDVDPSFKFTTATTVEEALKILKIRNFDTILCDHKLPGVITIHGKKFPSDGIHLMRKFRDEMKILTPFIFVTGQGSEEIASQALQLGAAGYFIKRVQPGYYSLMATSIRQIIDRYWLQRELEDSEMRYKDLFENSTGLIFIFDTNGNLQESNQNFYKIFGYSERDSIKYSQIAYKEDLDKWHTMISSIVNGNNEIQLLRSLTKEGTVLHLDVNARPIWDQNGRNVIGIQAIARDISDQVKTQQALIDSEEKHRKIVEESIDGLIFLDSEETIVDWNPAATIITGISQEEAVGRNFYKLITLLKPSRVNFPDIMVQTDAEIHLEYKKLFPTKSEPKSPEIFDYSLENVLTGKRHILETVGFIVEHSKGDRIALVIRDVTERRVAEAESRSFAKRFQILIEQTAIGVWVSDAKTEITTYVNESVAQLLGYTAREMIGVSVLDFATPESAKIIKAITESRFNNVEVDDTYELNFFHRDGSEIQTLVTGAAIYDENDQLLETYGLIRDITEERERERELKRTKKFLESIIASIPSGVYAYGLDHKITMANPRLANILGYTSENELIGRSLYDLFPAREQARVRGLVEERLHGDLIGEYISINYITRQGKEISTSVSAFPLNIGGRVEGAVVTVSDLTEKRQAEDYVQRISNEYRTLLEKLHLGILKVNNLGKIITYNDKAVEILKFADLIDIGTLNILEYHPFKEAGVTNKFRDLLYKKTTEATIAADITDRTGKVHNLNFFFYPITNQFSEIIAWFLFIEKMH
ncbi:MAG: PAS domain S-box protein [Candidatus Hodarchaeales archaeon]|jgi:PAS domain S-box-containing protein